MSDSAGYELVDAGDGRRLERFGEVVVDRPAPGATSPRRDLGALSLADLRFDRDAGWTSKRGLDPWIIELDDLTFELRPTETGQLGVFPEQAPNWRLTRDAAGAGRQILNLFAYTGGATLAAASAGASVVHVDASRPAVAWARRNAALSGLADRPIRWIVDDCEAYVRREARRGRRYDGIVLDPPSYGHGRGGAVWRLEDHLSTLLQACQRIAKPEACVILTAHATSRRADWLADALRSAFDGGRSIEAGELELQATSGARLWLGSCARIMPGL